jgi:hypothetical protein
VVLVREGFSPLAFLAPPAYALWHRQWLGLVAWLLAAGLLSGVTALAGVAPLADALISLAFSLLVGFGAHDWRRWRLGRAGYKEVGVVAGRRADEAEFRFFNAWLRPGLGGAPA